MSSGKGISRKEFLRRSIRFGGGLIGSALFPWSSKSGDAVPQDDTELTTFLQNDRTITILYTNDTHARIDPFPETAREFAMLGGVARRAHLIKQIRQTHQHVILLDAGDVFQGTPWFQLYGGEVDLRVMSEMGYDAMVIGNHEFDLGVEHLAEVAAHAKFPMLAANYRVHNTPLKNTIRPLTVLRRGSVRIGVFGVGIGLEGVVPKNLYGDIQMYETLTRARYMADSLRTFHKCDLVICLSHLGHQHSGGSNRPSTPDDLTLAQQVPGIDLIIGGHTHTFLDEPVQVQNPSGKTTLVTQMGHSGVRLGKLEINPECWQDTGTYRASFYEVGTALSTNPPRIRSCSTHDDLPSSRIEFR
ncbi:MAG: metallophosphatase [Bacteroidetes bacterium]|jgi:5'-nucleotidase|nr:MAG: metallophosphatase [Bacteroidota bacterium]PTM20066.1 MAG: metallophosphatase [Bacteroidota bacterium]